MPFSHSETLAPMQPDRYALLSGQALDSVWHDLTRGVLESVRHDGGGQLLVAPSAVQALHARLKRERNTVVPAEVRERSTRLPMHPQQFAELVGRDLSSLMQDLIRGAIPSERAHATTRTDPPSTSDHGAYLIPGWVVDEHLYRRAQARAQEG